MRRTSTANLRAWAGRHIGGRLLGTLTGVATREPVVALTFDDGPHPGSTPRLLESLERHGARATFFMLGRPPSAGLRSSGGRPRPATRSACTAGTTPRSR
jgi:peptidoglycan/xylan/chitin deacetylase (PgdA/CDA1 family)